MSPDKQKDKDQYIKYGRAEIKVELEILNSVTIYGFPAFALFDVSEKQRLICLAYSSCILQKDSRFIKRYEHSSDVNLPCIFL